MSKNRRKAQQKQEQWEREKAAIEDRREFGPQMKAALQAKGCILPFYDGLDLAEDEFRKLVAWAKAVFPSLHEVYEVNSVDFNLPSNSERLGLPGDWSQIFFSCNDERSSSYAIREPQANLRGATTAFEDPAGGLHTVIEVIKNPSGATLHKENKYILKLPTLLHEIGHAKDHHEGINFNREKRTANLVEAEVFAHLFALNECFSRAYYLSGEFYLKALEDHKDVADHRGLVIPRVLAAFRKPSYRKWTDYEV
jgi:hypothetical protein